MVLCMGSVGTTISGNYRRRVTLEEVTIGKCNCTLLLQVLSKISIPVLPTNATQRYGTSLKIGNPPASLPPFSFTPPLCFTSLFPFPSFANSENKYVLVFGILWYYCYIYFESHGLKHVSEPM